MGGTCQPGLPHTCAARASCDPSMDPEGGRGIGWDPEDDHVRLPAAVGTAWFAATGGGCVEMGYGLLVETQ